MSRIVIVEDNTTIAEGIAMNLQMEGHDVRIAASAAQGVTLCQTFAPALVILDIMLPDGTGIDALQRLRDTGFDAPVLLLSALGDEADKLRGFRAGADDYVTKPFGLLELLARVEVLLRRHRPAMLEPASTGGVLSFGDTIVNLSERTVLRRGEPVTLRPKEWELLLALVRHENAVVSRAALLREVWGYDTTVQSRTVDTHMVELRRKLGDDVDDPRYIVTVRKMGYRLLQLARGVPADSG